MKINTYLTIEHFHSVVVDAVAITDSHPDLLTHPKFQQVADETKTRVATYSEAYKRTKPESRLGTKDGERDNIFLLLFLLVDAYSRYTGELDNIGQQARRLRRTMLKYSRRLVRKGQQIESGDLKSFFDDLTREFTDQQLKLMPGVADAIAELKKANNAFLTVFQDSLVYKANLTPCATALTKELRSFFNDHFLPMVSTLALYEGGEFKVLNDELTVMIDQANKKAWLRIKMQRKKRDEARKNKPADGEQPAQSSDDAVHTAGPDAEITPGSGTDSGSDPGSDSGNISSGSDSDNDESKPMV